MKMRNGFVSNSSSSSFVVFKDALTKQQKDMIYDYQEYVKFFNTIDEKTIELFEYCNDSPWRIEEYDDFIFGETPMDNFSMPDYLEYIKVENKYVDWDDGYIDEPCQSQLDFINRVKVQFRKVKLDNLNSL